MPPAEPKTILVVDDDSEVCSLLKGLLGSEDRIVYVATTLGDAREILGSGKIDLVLLDLYLPDGNGIDFLADLKSSPSDPSAIIMTAFGSWETHVKAHHLGAYYYLDKPFKITQVRTLVEQALREKTLQ
ncbi:MAG TPA: response regulator [Acidobacteriota bacterium]|nr:response regulator [Acidobacteriota bacterium]